MSRKMTNTEYVENGKGKCPWCESDQITGDSVVIDEGMALQDCTCDDCGAGWTDIYKLAGYELSEEGEE